MADMTEKTELDLSQLTAPEFEGVIEKVAIMPLESYLGERKEAFIEKIRIPDNVTEDKEEAYIDTQMKRDVIVITVGVETTNFTTFITIPTKKGYNKSNMKKLVTRNQLPNLVSKWIGKSVKCMLDENNYYRLSV